MELDITSVRISASLIYEADVTTSLSNPMNDFADRLFCTILWSNFRQLSSSSSKPLNGSFASVTAVC